MYGGEQSDIFDVNVDLAKHKYIEDNLVCAEMHFLL